jgi:hypothetical protein
LPPKMRQLVKTQNVLMIGVAEESYPLTDFSVPIRSVHLDYFRLIGHPEVGSSTKPVSGGGGSLSI